ncbi:MAG: hypothetical protein PHQ60_16585 [Sideroxydans sp.]|nr:hypothetical protein [Sideroxydans sp.]
MNTQTRPTLNTTTTLSRPNPVRLLDQVIERTASGGFDPEAFHVLNERDNALIADEVMNGSGSSKFVYQFAISGTNVTGISVVGARHLATEYGGLRHRMVASTRKIGALFTFTSYPADGSPMRVSCSVIPELASEDDFYSSLVEVEDIKLGNTVQMEASETKLEKKRDGSTYERPHFQKIAQAKAYRNAILALIPQDVQLAWKDKMLSLGKNEVVTKSVIAEKRSGVMQFAAAKGVAVDRHALEALTMDQIAGLAEAARTKDLPQFVNAAAALGLVQTEQPEPQPEPTKPAPRKAATKAQRDEPPQREEPPPYDPETGEVERPAARAAAPQSAPQPVDDGELF